VIPIKGLSMKSLVPIPSGFVEHLKRATETGFGYKIVSVELKDGRHFDQVVTSEGCIIEVRGYKEIPFTPEDVASVVVNHKRWNFRDNSDTRKKSRAAAA
jgi:hypothetical protein